MKNKLFAFIFAVACSSPAMAADLTCKWIYTYGPTANGVKPDAGVSPLVNIKITSDAIDVKNSPFSEFNTDDGKTFARLLNKDGTAHVVEEEKKVDGKEVKTGKVFLAYDAGTGDGTQEILAEPSLTQAGGTGTLKMERNGGDGGAEYRVFECPAPAGN